MKPPDSFHPNSRSVPVHRFDGDETGPVKVSRGKGRKPAPHPTPKSRRQEPRSPLLTRRRMRGAAWAAGLVTLIAALVFLFASPVLAVRHIVVKGLAPLTPEEASQVQEAAKLPPHTNLMRAPAGRIAASLRKLPWVADAIVSRQLPDHLVITIKARLPVTVLTTPAGRWELDGRGIPIRPAQMMATLPEIVANMNSVIEPGVAVDLPGVAGALSVVEMAKRGKPIQIAKIEVDQNADLCLNMQDSVAIRLGQVEDLPQKLTLVHRIYEEKPDIGTEVARIDLRCLDAPACLPRSATNRTDQTDRTDAITSDSANNQTDHRAENRANNLRRRRVRVKDERNHRTHRTNVNSTSDTGQPGGDR